MVATAWLAGVTAFLALTQVLTIALGLVGVAMSPLLAFAVVALAAVLAVGFGLSVRRHRVFAPPTEAPGGPGRWLDRGLVLLAGVAIAWTIVVWLELWVLAWHRSPVGWDELWYHVAAINDWVTRGGVGFHALGPALASVPHEVELAGWLNLPMGVELTGFLLYYLAGQSDRLIDAANLPYWPLAFFSLVVIAERLGARGIWRWLAGGLLSGVSLYVIQGATLYVDAGFASATMAAIAATLIFVFDDEVATWAKAVLLGASAGLMLGAKGVGAPFFVVVVVVAGVASIVVARGAGWRGRLGGVLAALALAMPVGGYWYLRNAVHTGNPIYPIQLQLGHKVLAPGYDITGYDRLDWVVRPVLKPYPPWSRTPIAWLQRDLPIFQPENGPNYAPAGGLGFVWLLGGLPAAGYLLVLALRRPRERESRPLLLLFGLTVLLYLATTIPWQARFTFWLQALGLPAVALVLSDAARNWRRRRLQLLAAGLGVLVIGVAGWESQATARYEWRVGRDGAAPGLSFRQAVDSLWPGMRHAPGFVELWRADHIGRGPWVSTEGTLATGMLAMPLGRRVEVLPPTPDAELLRRLRYGGIEWVLWEAADGDSLPAALVANADQIHRYERYGDHDFFAIRLDCMPGPLAGGEAR